MAEIYTLRPLFPGSSEVDEIFKCVSVLGNPSQNTWPEGLQLAKKMNFKFPNMSPTPLQQLIPQASSDGIDIMTKLMMWNPAHRPSCQETLRHPYFAGCTPMVVAAKPVASDGGHEAVQTNPSANESPSSSSRNDEKNSNLMKSANNFSSGSHMGSGGSSANKSTSTANKPDDPTPGHQGSSSLPHESNYASPATDHSPGSKPHYGAHISPSQASTGNGGVGGYSFKKQPSPNAYRGDKIGMKSHFSPSSILPTVTPPRGVRSSPRSGARLTPSNKLNPLGPLITSPSGGHGGNKGSYDGGGSGHQRPQQSPLWARDMSGGRARKDPSPLHRGSGGGAKNRKSPAWLGGSVHNPGGNGYVGTNPASVAHNKSKWTFGGGNSDAGGPRMSRSPAANAGHLPALDKSRMAGGGRYGGGGLSHQTRYIPSGAALGPGGPYSLHNHHNHNSHHHPHGDPVGRHAGVRGASGSVRHGNNSAHGGGGVGSATSIGDHDALDALNALRKRYRGGHNGSAGASAGDAMRANNSTVGRRGVGGTRRTDWSSKYGR